MDQTPEYQNNVFSIDDEKKVFVFCLLPLSLSQLASRRTTMMIFQLLSYQLIRIMKAEFHLTN